MNFKFMFVIWNPLCVKKKLKAAYNKRCFFKRNILEIQGEDYSFMIY